MKFKEFHDIQREGNHTAQFSLEWQTKLIIPAD
jgi:hypothetical protein